MIPRDTITEWRAHQRRGFTVDVRAKHVYTDTIIIDRLLPAGQAQHLPPFPEPQPRRAAGCQTARSAIDSSAASASRTLWMTGGIVWRRLSWGNQSISASTHNPLLLRRNQNAIENSAVTAYI